MSQQQALLMKISLNALEHLGMNLYSNIPAVLSEIVANAWDADAEEVTTKINKDKKFISIRDNGNGMTRAEVIDRFLTVGYRRRKDIGTKTPGGRNPMGRKGIGKLSSFSISGIVDVYTIRDGERTAFRMDRQAIQDAINNENVGSYRPNELTDWPQDLTQGTEIILRDVSKNMSEMTVNALKRRVARRFSIIGSKHRFRVLVNGSEIKAQDRGYHNKIQFLWIYEDDSAVAKMAKYLAKPAVNRNKEIKIACEEAGITLRGWIGTVRRPIDLSDEEGDNLNHIAIFMRGKMAQEDILGDFGQKEIFADYLIGELHCEELDDDNYGDIATSSRQSLKDDDERFSALKGIVRNELRHIASKWSEWRKEEGAKEARGVPEVAEWLDGLRGATRKKAESWVGRLNVIRSPNEIDKKEILKASILAFESYRRKEDLERLDAISDSGIEDVLQLFREIDDLELSYYGQIVKGRVGVIRALRKNLDDNVKEHIIRDFLFEHPWLLDPSWERARGSEDVETNINNFLKADSAKLNDEERRARIDIGYRTAAGRHVIIELKRASVTVSVYDLMKQVSKYRDGARKILATTTYADWPLDIVCLVGKSPSEWGTEDGKRRVIDGLKTVDARLVFYDQLLQNAQQSYADYLEEHKKIDKLWKIFEAIENFAPDVVNIARADAT